MHTHYTPPTLPEEVWHEIFSFLSPCFELLVIHQLSRLFYNLVDCYVMQNPAAHLELFQKKLLYRHTSNSAFTLSKNQVKSLLPQTSLRLIDRSHVLLAYDRFEKKKTLPILLPLMSTQFNAKNKTVSIQIQWKPLKQLLSDPYTIQFVMTVLKKNQDHFSPDQRNSLFDLTLERLHQLCVSSPSKLIPPELEQVKCILEIIRLYINPASTNHRLKELWNDLLHFHKKNPALASAVLLDFFQHEATFANLLFQYLLAQLKASQNSSVIFRFIKDMRSLWFKLELNQCAAIMMNEYSEISKQIPPDFIEPISKIYPFPNPKLRTFIKTRIEHNDSSAAWILAYIHLWDTDHIKLYYPKLLNSLSDNDTVVNIFRHWKEQNKLTDHIPSILKFILDQIQNNQQARLLHFAEREKRNFELLCVFKFDWNAKQTLAWVLDQTKNPLFFLNHFEHNMEIIHALWKRIRAPQQKNLLNHLLNNLIKKNKKSIPKLIPFMLKHFSLLDPADFNQLWIEFYKYYNDADNALSTCNEMLALWEPLFKKLEKRENRKKIKSDYTHLTPMVNHLIQEMRREKDSAKIDVDERKIAFLFSLKKTRHKQKELIELASFFAAHDSKTCRDLAHHYLMRISPLEKNEMISSVSLTLIQSSRAKDHPAFLRWCSETWNAATLQKALPSLIEFMKNLPHTAWIHIIQFNQHKIRDCRDSRERLVTFIEKSIALPKMPCYSMLLAKSLSTFFDEIELARISTALLPCLIENGWAFELNSLLALIAQWMPFFSPTQSNQIGTFLHDLVLSQPDNVFFIENFLGFTVCFSEQQKINLAGQRVLNHFHLDEKPTFCSQIAVPAIAFLNSLFIHSEPNTKNELLKKINADFSLFHEEVKPMLFDAFSSWISNKHCSLKNFSSLSSIRQYCLWPLLESVHMKQMTLENIDQQPKTEGIVANNSSNMFANVSEKSADTPPRVPSP